MNENLRNNSDSLLIRLLPIKRKIISPMKYINIYSFYYLLSELNKFRAHTSTTINYYNYLNI